MPWRAWQPSLRQALGRCWGPEPFCAGQQARCMLPLLPPCLQAASRARRPPLGRTIGPTPPSWRSAHPWTTCCLSARRPLERSPAPAWRRWQRRRKGLTARRRRRRCWARPRPKCPGCCRGDVRVPAGAAWARAGAAGGMRQPRSCPRLVRPPGLSCSGLTAGALAAACFPGGNVIASCRERSQSFNSTAGLRKQRHRQQRDHLMPTHGVGTAQAPAAPTCIAFACQAKKQCSEA